MYCRTGAVILAARFELDPDYIVSLPIADVWSIIRSHRMIKARSEGLKICFRGFTPPVKQQLTEVAIRHRYVPEGLLGRQLDFLCVGRAPSALKLEKAFGLGIQLLTEPQFYRLMATGDIEA